MRVLNPSVGNSLMSLDNFLDGAFRFAVTIHAHVGPVAATVLFDIPQEELNPAKHLQHIAGHRSRVPAPSGQESLRHRVLLLRTSIEFLKLRAPDITGAN